MYLSLTIDKQVPDFSQVLSSYEEYPLYWRNQKHSAAYQATCEAYMISFKLFLKFRLGLLWVALAVLLAIPFLTLGDFRKTPPPLPPPKVLTFTSGTPGTPAEM